MYKTYKLADFRKDTRQILNQALLEPIRIKRHGDIFELRLVEQEGKPASLNGGIWDVGQPTQEQIDSKPPDPAPEPEIGTSQNVMGGMPCCEKTKRCKHWEHDPLDGVWKNQLTVETREII